MALRVCVSRPGKTGCGQPGTIQLELVAQLNNAHPEGWRDRPCEAPATITVTCVRARSPVTGAKSGPRLIPAAGTDEEERPRKREHILDHHPFQVWLRQRPRLPRVRAHHRTRRASRVCRVFRAAGGDL